MIRIETERLIIRDHIIEDQQSLHRLLTSKKAMYYLPEIYCQATEDVEHNLTVSIQESINPQRTKYYFAIEEKTYSFYIGEIGVTLNSSSSEGGIANLGYFILPEQWGHGYVTEAAQGLIKFVFQSLSCHKITTGCFKENVASERIMQKCGMIKEAEYKQHIWHDNTWKDRIEYRLLREEWEAFSSSQKG